jgi:hypothetical protein
MESSKVISAWYEPGFSRDGTYWQVFIGRNRRLRQKVVTLNPGSAFDKRVLWFRAKLSRQDVAGLWEIVERIGFLDFDRHYTHRTMSVIDCPTYRIAVRFGDRLKEVEAYDLRRLAEFERQPDMNRFRELWDAITARAPFGKVPIAEGLPRQRWRSW